MRECGADSEKKFEGAAVCARQERVETERKGMRNSFTFTLSFR
jgi:hypothetical protein